MILYILSSRLRCWKQIYHRWLYDFILPIVIGIYILGELYDIFIYDPYIDDEDIYSLKGHNSSVNSIALIPENNELISINI